MVDSDSEIDEESLKMVAKHGSNEHIRSLAILKLAEKNNRMDELKEKL